VIHVHTAVLEAVVAQTHLAVDKLWQSLEQGREGVEREFVSSLCEHVPVRSVVIICEGTVDSCVAHFQEEVSTERLLDVKPRRRLSETCNIDGRHLYVERCTLDLFLCDLHYAIKLEDK